MRIRFLRLLPAAAAAVAAAAVITLPPSASAASHSAPPHPAKVYAGVVADVGARPGVTAHAASAALPYGGGAVMHSNRTFLFFWQPAGSGLTYDPGYIPLIERYLADVAAASHTTGNVYGLTGQYHDAYGPAAYASTYGGAVLDTAPLPASGCVEPPVTGPGWTNCLTDTQYESELLRMIHLDGLPTGPGNIYFIVTPAGLGSCEASGPENCALGGTAPGSYCGYHSSTPDNEVLYAVIPYNAVAGHCQSDLPRPNGNPADPTLSTLSHEHNETITDPFGDGYIDSQGNENGDLCISAYGPDLGGTGQSAWNESINGGHYYLQEEYSDLDGGCRASGHPVDAAFSQRLLAGRRLVVTGRGSSAGASIVSYQWSFGDGTLARGRSLQHGYRRAGRYSVFLRVTDSNGNYGYAASSVRVPSR